MEINGPAGEMAKAEWITRLIAELIDIVAWTVTFLPLTVGIVIGIVLGNVAGFLVFLIGLAVTLAALVWVALKYQNGQSVGKHVMGTQVVRADDGAPLSWAFNFIVRTILVKGLVVEVASSITFGIFTLVNYLWPLWDGKRQAVHDKMVGTYVVKLR